MGTKPRARRVRAYEVGAIAETAVGCLADGSGHVLGGDQLLRDARRGGRCDRRFRAGGLPLVSPLRWRAYMPSSRGFGSLPVVLPAVRHRDLACPGPQCP